MCGRAIKPVRPRRGTTELLRLRHSDYVICDGPMAHRHRVLGKCLSQSAGSRLSFATVSSDATKELAVNRDRSLNSCTRSEGGGLARHRVRDPKDRTSTVPHLSALVSKAELFPGLTARAYALPALRAFISGFRSAVSMNPAPWTAGNAAGLSSPIGVDYTCRPTDPSPLSPCK